MSCLVKVPNRDYDMSSWFMEKIKKSIDEQVNQLNLIESLKPSKVKEELYENCIMGLKYLCNMFFFMNGVEVNADIIQNIINNKNKGLEEFEVYCGINERTEKDVNKYYFENLTIKVRDLIASDDRSNRTLIYDYISKNRDELYFCKKDIERIIEILDEVTINNIEWRVATTLIKRVLDGVRISKFN